MIDNALVAVKFMTDRQLLDRVEALSMQLARPWQSLVGAAMAPYVDELWERNRGFNA